MRTRHARHTLGEWIEGDGTTVASPPDVSRALVVVTVRDGIAYSQVARGDVDIVQVDFDNIEGSDDIDWLEEMRDRFEGVEGYQWATDEIGERIQQVNDNDAWSREQADIARQSEIEKAKVTLRENGVTDLA